MKDIPVLKLHTWDISFREEDNMMFISSNPECFKYGHDRFLGVADISHPGTVAMNVEESNRFLIIKGLRRLIRVDAGHVPIWKMKYEEKIEEDDKVLGEMI